ncbi:4-alpha-glucanotransferase [Pontibacter silvestris]|uniref:4-alpha-glucanotransferase n=1 Tax=Pontibacter silvestris TaxID=2305183 RepID=A0ABW4WVX8_9BACT|nr:4-alpha-glucanotransferase [Pontibacter silvestris]MCC9138377.1 4-alpha-glucanotransferase [Pontibacter silvestris]
MIIDKRSSGLLLHITSLPSRFGIGDLGPEAYAFADLLQEAGQRFWQILPLNPTELAYDNSPYSSHSAFAGNHLLISPELLIKDGLLEEKELDTKLKFDDTRVEFEQVIDFKKEILHKTFLNYQGKQPKELKKAFEAFQKEHKAWLQDYTMFVVFKNHFGDKGWTEWPKEIKHRQKNAMQDLVKELADELEKEKFMQFLFYHQWEQLRQYCHEKDISFFGDMPFYVSHDSADVWSNPKYFKLDKEGMPTAVSGVPPDFFSETGQLWGTPVYNWKELAEHNYDWWIRRIDHNLRQFGLLRLDHFRAFSAYWEVPADEDTAINGKWEKSPGHEILTIIRDKYPQMPIIAEDLGDIDQPVRDLISNFSLPGMLVLVFAFVGDEKAFESSFMPHNHVRNSIVYTGTHDNSTARAWFDEATAADKRLLSDYSFHRLTKDNVHEVMQRLALASVAQLAVLPMQDVLGLGAEATMNKPSTTGGNNWKWRLKPSQFTKKEAKALKKLVDLYGR